MLLETAQVVAVEPDSVWVETIRQSSCGSCSAQKGCGHSLLSKLSAGRRSYIQVFSGLLSASDCSVDDQVQISIPESVVVSGSLLVYILPLVFMLIGATVASSFAGASPDFLAISGAVVGFAAGMAVVRLHAWFHRFDRALQPSLTAMVSRATNIVSVS